MQQSDCEINRSRLVKRLSDVLEASSGHAVERIETHISWVLLCGDRVYKIKKPVDLGFLDFSTLKKRKHYCEEEIRLNGRLAPQLYLDVASITGSEDQPELDGDGPAIEYAVRMARFSQDRLLVRLAECGELKAHHADQMSQCIGRFHQRIPAADPDSELGTPERVKAPVDENFDQIRQRLTDAGHLSLLTELQRWTDQSHQALRAAFTQRKTDGFVRECHGDMHLGNMAYVNNELLIFDGIEFNPNLYWIDVMSEVAFLCMDLQDHDLDSLAYRFLNGYLELTGDYEGVSVLRYYQLYRAMVRAKVASIRMEQETTGDLHSSEARELENYLRLAQRYTHAYAPLLLINHGLSGSGKSTLTGDLLERIGAVRIRSDRERQRLFAEAPRPGNREIDQGIYSSNATRQTYQRLLGLSRSLLRAGWPVIVDATFLKREQRDAFKDLADELGVAARILHFHAPADTLRTRVRARSAEGKDVSEAGLKVLEHQLEHYEGLDSDEHEYTLTIDTHKQAAADRIQAMLPIPYGSPQ